jgi:tryptophanyl-tRNA synthetase
MSEVILSGIRATGRLHFGNFIGAVRHFVDFQKPGNECYYFIADLHTLTTRSDPDLLRKNLREIVKDYLAAGLDPNECTIYAQSSVLEIPMLSLLLSNLQPLGDLLGVTTYKEQVRKNPDNVNLGLVTYPVLMAADIIGPKATLVPVGSDQVPNIELTRELVRRFNSQFGETLVMPRMMEQMDRVPGLDGAKMGKSEADNAIELTSSKDEILERYKRKGITDDMRKLRTDPGDPHNRCKSVYPLHALITPSEQGTSVVIAKQCMAAEITCTECKGILVDSIMRYLVPFQEKRRELAERDDLVTEILHEGGKKARKVIAATTAEVQDKMGIFVY